MPITSALQGWGYGEARRVLGQTPMRSPSVFNFYRPGLGTCDVEMH